jgi:ATP-dependent 26S proteasome regulatory subunit
MSSGGKFVVKSITDFSEMKEGMVIKESDLCFQNEDRIIQCEYVKDENKSNKYTIKPGAHTLSVKNGRVILDELNLRQRRLLSSYDNSKKIMDEAKLFFSQKEIYEFLEKDMKRAIMLYSPPGFGKTSAISKLSQDLLEEDPGTVVISWPTGEIDANYVSRFFSRKSEYSKECTRLVFIIEDIGGGEVEDRGGQRGIDSSLLNLLDGVDVTFSLPTFIIATTNYPGNLLDALADRPGRFDEFIELDPPTFEQRVELIEFIAKRKITDEEKNALEKAENFSVAHLTEIVERSLLKSKDYATVIDEIITHKKNFTKNFEKVKKGVGLSYSGR